MTITMPARIRLVLYIITALGGPLVAYLVAKDYIGDAEVVLFGGWTTVISAMAGFNINTTPKDNGRAGIDNHWPVN